VPEEKVQSVVAKITEIINKNDGVIISEDFPKLRNLAYEIKKRVETKYLRFNKAYFGWIKFESLGSVVLKIKKEIENNQDILRFIIVKTVRENTIYSPKFSAAKNTTESEVKSVESSVSEEKVEISEEEIDKSIDELLDEEKIEN
jgi:ribosomal protein S6